MNWSEETTTHADGNKPRVLETPTSLYEDILIEIAVRHGCDRQRLLFARHLYLTGQITEKRS